MRTALYVVIEVAALVYVAVALWKTAGLDADRARLVRTSPCAHCLEERVQTVLVCTRCGCVVPTTAPNPFAEAQQHPHFDHGGSS